MLRIEYSAEIIIGIGVDDHPAVIFIIADQYARGISLSKGNDLLYNVLHGI